jgi:hypothetical protein
MNSLNLNLKVISILLLFHFFGFIEFIESYVLPQTFREFHPIGIYSNVNKNKPYEFKLGCLPLLTWFPNANDNDNANANNPITIINSCKHLGNNLKEGSLNKNKSCLICPFHKTSYNELDNFGTTVVKNGIIWWSYKSYSKNPPYLKTNDYYHKTVDININLIGFVLNFLGIYFDDLNDSNDSTNKIYVKHKDNTKRIFIKNKDNTKRILFSYPYTFFISDNKRPTYMISLLPLDETKTRIYISINNNYDNYFLNNFLFMSIKTHLEKAHNDFLFSKKFMFNLKLKKYNSITYLEKIYNFYSNYSPLNDVSIYNFINNYKYY